MKTVKTDYEKTKELGLIYDRWTKGTEHHPKSVRLMEFLEKTDLHDYNDSFSWKIGGDGDNGETLMFQMDAFFELLDILEQKQVSDDQSK